MYANMLDVIARTALSLSLSQSLYQTISRPREGAASHTGSVVDDGPPGDRAHL